MSMAYLEHLSIPGAFTKFHPDKVFIISLMSTDAFPTSFTRLKKT